MNQESVNAILTSLRYARRIFNEHKVEPKYLPDFDTSCNTFNRDEWLQVVHGHIESAISLLKEVEYE